MAELVIDWFEAVKIHEGKPYRRCILAGHVQRILSLRFEQGAVRKAGEMIVLQCSNVGMHDNSTHAFIRFTRLADGNLKPMMSAIKGAGIRRHKLPKLAVKDAGYTLSYGLAIKTSTISCSVTLR